MSISLEAPSAPRWSAGLNAEQRRAVEHEGGPLLVIAGAGTGKTRTLVARLARLIDDGVAPERILLVTFSRRAAAELIRRAGHLIDPALAARIQAGTFHSVAHSVLRRCGSALNLPDGFTLLDQGDASDLVGLVRAPIATTARQRFPRTQTVVSIYSRVVSSRTPLDEMLVREFPWCVPHLDGIRTVFTQYTERKRSQHLLDFEDLLLFWRAAVADPLLGPVLAADYDHVLVDEYQDTSEIQAEILRALRVSDARITVVGDDAQAIYAFRSATVRNILDFPDHFVGTTVVKLEQNYRSTEPILALANAVIAGSSEGYKKALWTDQPGGVRPVLATCPDQASQADAVCRAILEHHERGIALRNQVVLFRAAHHSDLLEIELRRRNLPFVKYGGLRFLEAAHVRDLLAALRLLDNPFDEMAWMRVLQLAEGIGPVSARRLIVGLGVDTESAGDPLARFLDDPTGAGAVRSNDELDLLAGVLQGCRVPGNELGVQIDCIAQGFEPMIRHRYDHPDSRLADFEALARLAVDYPTRDRFVAELTLDPPASTGDLAGPPSLDDDWLTLSTVHSAKGGEWDAVHLIHAADGAFPSDMATRSAAGVDEERRLFYVALTRARRHLHIYAPLRYHHGDPQGRRDDHSYALRTRFLPRELDDLLDHRSVRAAIDAPLPMAVAPATDIVDAALRELW